MSRPSFGEVLIGDLHSTPISEAENTATANSPGRGGCTTVDEWRPFPRDSQRRQQERHTGIRLYKWLLEPLREGHVAQARILRK